MRALVAGGLGLVVAWFAFVARKPVPILDWFDLAVHETGHMLAAPLPRIAMFMAGSFAQIAVPLALAWYFGWRRRDLVGGGFCLVWAGASAWDVSVYAGDAIRQALPLVGGGQHDWAFILGYYDALHLTYPIARGIFIGGAVLAVAGLMTIVAGALWPEFRAGEPVVRMRSEPLTDPSEESEDPWLEAAKLPFRYEADERKSA